MRIAMISDIHGNFAAFVKCLEDIERSDVDRIVNLGDAIGYGPQPEEVLGLLEKMDIPNIIGNHELAAINRKFRRELSPQAFISLKRTLAFLTSASLIYVKSLPCCQSMEGALMVHGCPPDSLINYLDHMSLSEIKATFSANSFNIAFAGHTHRLMLVSYHGGHIEFDTLNQEIFRLNPGHRYIVNVGAVGQPRDGDPRAKYVIWDNRRSILEIRRVAYDIEKTAKLTLQRGFVFRDAQRLYKGT